MGLLHGLTQRVVNVQWGSLAEQQGLVAEYPPGPGAPTFENPAEVLAGEPLAFAESGQAYPGINMGASGLGYTVLTSGLICFGQPRDGNACFIACPKFKYKGDPREIDYTLFRGVEEEGNLIWLPIHNSADPLIALTFAGDAFFAVYNPLDRPVTNISVSFDGLIWSAANEAFSADAGQGGAVAGFVKTVGDRKESLYSAVGEIYQPSDIYQVPVLNLMSSSSRNGLAWSQSFNPGSQADPGTWFNLLHSYSCTVGGGLIRGQGVFVAAAGAKSTLFDPGTDSIYVMTTAAAAVSSNGNDWGTSIVGGLPASLEELSFGLAATYVRTSKDNGYFLMTDHELKGGEGFSTPRSTLYKSPDGHSWTPIRSSTNWMASLSPIAKDLNKQKIVFI